MVKILERLATEGFIEEERYPMLFDKKIYKLSDAAKLYILYVLKIYGSIIWRNIISIIKTSNERWSISYIFKTNLNEPLYKYKEVINPKNRFLADPFVMNYNGKTNNFVEYLEGFVERVGIERGLKKYSINEEQIKELAEIAFQDVCHQTSPKKVTKDDFLTIFKENS